MLIILLECWLVTIAVSTVGGYFLGRPRDMGWSGAAWGLALGPLGLLLFMTRYP
ncbi:hypothetical protein KBB96_07415 [Luteolibacter ambystomatis]|uniref:Uncharacterized protein n=1 Tax=Luteolibacter ambystomatis TaxID=2824561 RepID=A0A975J2D3_9BACT|nr:hypothetical protein [Luteolibacter ambystomatis]QUE52714.1 hypothetical protein KBB96_07415 [Luteolibacter ambystomatis]